MGMWNESGAVDQEETGDVRAVHDIASTMPHSVRPFLHLHNRLSRRVLVLVQINKHPDK